MKDGITKLGLINVADALNHFIGPSNLRLMLLNAPNRMIFIGNSNVDKLAAKSAGAVFLDVHEVNLFESITQRINQ